MKDFKIKQTEQNTIFITPGVFITQCGEKFILKKAFEMPDKSPQDEFWYVYLDKESIPPDPKFLHLPDRPSWKAGWFFEGHKMMGITRKSPKPEFRGEIKL